MLEASSPHPIHDWRRAHWPEAGDFVAAQSGMAEWREVAQRHPEAAVRAFALALADDPQGQRLLRCLFGNSRFLGDAARREMAFMRRMLRLPLQETLRLLINEVNETPALDTGDIMRALRISRRRAALTIALADIGDLWPLDDVMQAYSRFADACIQAAARHALLAAQKQGALGAPETCAFPEVGSGYLLIAVGKLGSEELNFSSDVDLLAFYDPAAPRVTDADKAAKHFIRVTQQVGDILSARTEDGYVFRTDFRLRPDPASTPLCVSLASAETYYQSVAQTWERAALMRARIVLGDTAAYQQFVQITQPFIWRRNLDFAAVDDIQAIKQQIQVQTDSPLDDLNGHNIKTGVGGIREIEFFCQTQQLIYGGRRPFLRTGNICAALVALSHEQHITPDTAHALRESYLFLRRVEHRLQMLDDQQRYHLPESNTGIAELACFLGHGDPALLRDALWFHLRRVQGFYAALFPGRAEDASVGTLVFTGVDVDPATVNTLQQLGFSDPARVVQRVRHWLSGNIPSLRSDKTRRQLLLLLPKLLKVFGRLPLPDDALAMCDTLFSRMGMGGALLSQLLVRSDARILLAEVLGNAPYLAQRLLEKSSLLEVALLQGGEQALPELTPAMEQLERDILRSQNLEELLILLQEWNADHRFAIGLAILRGLAGQDQGRPQLSQLAEVTVQHLLAFHMQEFRRKHGDFSGAAVCVLALGRLGSRTMTLRSDLDLILLYRDQPVDLLSDGTRPLSAPQYYTRLTQALVTSLTSPTRRGPFYTVDLRLRPSGNAGPLATSFESFEKYQAESAWTWEHMALIRGRVVAGDNGLAEQVEGVIRRTLTQTRDPAKLRADVLDMRQRLAEEFPGLSLWDLKHRPGGVLDIDFLAQYLALKHSHAHPDILSQRMTRILQAAARHRILAEEDAAFLSETLRLWRQLIGWLAVTAGQDFVPERATPSQQKQLLDIYAAVCGERLDFIALQAKLSERQIRVRALWSALL